MVRIDFMRTFLQVVEKGSLKKAAKELGMSISSVSFQINSLESFYGAKLLRRGVSGVTLTEEGKLAIKNMKSIIESVEETRKLISNLKGEKLTLASGMVGIYIVPHIQTLLKTKYPELDVNILLRGAHECIKKLRESEVDFTIVGDLPEDEDDRFFITELGTDRLVLIVPPDHPLASKSEVTLDEVLEYPLIFLTEDYGITSSLKKALVSSGVNLDDIKVGYVVNDFFSQLHSVSNGLGIAITSMIASWRACEVGLVKVRDIKGFKSERSVYFVTTRILMESEKMMEYAHFVIENGRRLFADFKQRCEPIL
ncbi:LysR family transcriptional regulator [Archaeoglobus veneficus]|uniref:Transcriptional regulator, LysR family n=1 Tax=Archaeoglobus veneficus (strain DSM 11195 / SNP6) TaxID=693661 RepID=F2KT20_ARCVS|nr:LysR family transcriptional regulator [Archaeoglobus veneficus]AEA47050.1 transcriptional regulator, LysR family [Archaeoglobus veneficus SNP6]